MMQKVLFEMLLQFTQDQPDWISILLHTVLAIRYKLTLSYPIWLVQNSCFNVIIVFWFIVSMAEIAIDLKNIIGHYTKLQSISN